MHPSLQEEIRLSWLTAIDCRRTLKKINLESLTNIPLGRNVIALPNKFCIRSRPKVCTQTCVEMCLVINSLHFHLLSSCSPHFPGVHGYNTGNSFWFKLGSHNWSHLFFDLLHRLSTACKIYLLQHCLKCTSIFCGFLRGLINVRRRLFSCTGIWFFMNTS